MADTRVPELVADLEAQAIACLMENVPTLDGQTATIISKKLSQHLSCNWGGQLIYFPKNQGGELDERDKQIYAEFDGKNHQELARKYNLAVQRIYKIIKAAAAHEMANRQGSLLDD
ncbi:Mor transcription activator family protein [Kingella kingae]|uniref:Mor transcription activator family protein n=1 Tax=Kingella kingae TaxID=504 RepID=UPI00254DE2A9|nr:Mor transcription activator family protein [Kingella kingae]MDK4544763.1 Mor transcription activator family protein [Kingella kingae]MDK4566846.1 Mor transcription activator family protein [Kingella kingae]MDK4589837.1 Mor transcription activator family protein [Kingella kingae]MDK4628527.1 Mor transcription activator family protein [Kingella kingae]MDK4636407.1 Mor transcription activator family protein [Kingella kingae]